MVESLPSHVQKIDCMIPMHECANNSFDLALCDVPYGIDLGKMAFLAQEESYATQPKGGKRRLHRKKFKPVEWDNKVPDQSYFNEVRRVSKAQIIFGAHLANWEGLGSGSIKWDKRVPESVTFNRYEYAYCSAIDHERVIALLWSGMMQAKSLAEPITMQGNKKLNEKRIHPCQKPVLLYKRLLLDYAFPGAKILDTHVGSGSSRIAAYEVGCEYFGTEADPGHFADQEKRFKAHITQLRLF